MGLAAIASGALVGGMFGASRWGAAGATWASEKFWMGAAIGGGIGGALDMLTPDIDKRKGTLGNLVGGAAWGATASIGASLTMASMLPGGFGARNIALPIIRKIGKEVPKLAEKYEWIGRAGKRLFGPEEGAAKKYYDTILERYATKGRFGAQEAWMKEKYNDPIKYLLGTPNLVGEMAIAAGRKEPRFLKELSKKEFENALLKDAWGSAKYGALGGLAVGGIANMYYAYNRQPPNDPNRGVYGDGMYMATGIASNSALNPL